MPSCTSDDLELPLIRCHPAAMVSFPAQNSLHDLKPCEVNIPAEGLDRVQGTAPVLRLRSAFGFLSLRFESKVSFRWLTSADGHFLRLRTISLLPSGQSIVARSHVAERVRAVIIAGAGRSLHHRHVAAHPRMNIALHMDRDFFRRPRNIEGGSSCRL